MWFFRSQKQNSTMSEWEMLRFADELLKASDCQVSQAETHNWTRDQKIQFFSNTTGEELARKLPPRGFKSFVSAKNEAFQSVYSAQKGKRKKDINDAAFINWPKEVREEIYFCLQARRKIHTIVSNIKQQSQNKIRSYQYAEEDQPENNSISDADVWQVNDVLYKLGGIYSHEVSDADKPQLYRELRKEGLL
jgi:hypothetical protein